MTIKNRMLLLAFLTGTFVCLVWSVNHYHDAWLNQKQRADTAEEQSRKQQRTIHDMMSRQREVAALDARYTKELADAKAENDALQRRLDNGGRVLVKGRCPVPSPAEPTATSGVGYDATVELSSVAERNILGIRSGIISDQTALRALQDYIRQQCLR